MNHSARRINALAATMNAETYLEIGVDRGETFLDVEIMHKTGVDPFFKFDISSHSVALSRFVSMPSDTFFAGEPLHVSKAYDVVFIDGMHTFEQALRDLNNTLLRTHEGSAILIDDTIPEDVYSSLPNMLDALFFRQEVGGASLGWHGDVYKLVCYINDFLPSLNYRTIIGSGNPQTLVWRPKKPRGFHDDQLFNCLEVISRLDYFGLKRNKDVLRTCSEEEALDMFKHEVF